jgi:hypothetical protein
MAGGLAAAAVLAAVLLNLRPHHEQLPAPPPAESAPAIAFWKAVPQAAPNSMPGAAAVHVRRRPVRPAVLEERAQNGARRGQFPADLAVRDAPFALPKYTRKTVRDAPFALPKYTRKTVRDAPFALPKYTRKTERAAPFALPKYTRKTERAAPFALPKYTRKTERAAPFALPTGWSPAEPTVEIALPADALFPPGAVPLGFSFIADVRPQP